MEIKGYGIYSGCIHEGGGCDNIIYLNKQDARNECLKRVKVENDQLTEFNNEGSDYNFELFSEKKPNYWQNRHDCICIQEFTILGQADAT